MYKFYSSYPIFSSLVGGASLLLQQQRRKAIHDRRKAKAQEEQQLREAKHERRRAKSRLDTEAAGGPSAGGPAVEENPCADNDAMGPIRLNNQCDGEEDSVTYEIIPVGRGACSGKHCYNIDTLRRIAREGDNRDPQTRRLYNGQEFIDAFPADEMARLQAQIQAARAQLREIQNQQANGQVGGAKPARRDLPQISFVSMGAHIGDK